MQRAFDWKASLAAEVMQLGGVVAYPTEAVWGLGTDPYQERAVKRILTLKQRPQEKGLILISGQAEHFLPYLEGLPEELVRRFFTQQDRPTTWLVPDIHNRVPPWVKGEHSSVAMRLTTHPPCVALSKHFGGVVVSTSANPASKPSAMSLSEVHNYFRGRLEFCYQASLGGGQSASQIKDLESGKVLRV